MYKLLRILLEKSILPASLIIVGKVLGIYIAIAIFNFDFYFSNNIENFTTFQVVLFDEVEAITTTKISNITVLILIAAGLIISTLRYLFLSKSKNDPNLLGKIMRMNLFTLLSSEKDLFLEISVWSIFLLIATTLVFIDVIRFQMNTLFIFALIFVIIVTISNILYIYGIKQRKKKREHL